jgi:acetoin utilization deacetylase AcuC-like enzyme
MHIVFAEAQLGHRPGGYLVRGVRRPCPETPERATVLKEAAQAAGHLLVAPDAYGPGPRAAVHTPRYLRFLETAHERWQALEGASPEVIPNVHPMGRASGYPESVVGQAGFHMADTACPLAAGSWTAITASADAAVHAARLVQTGEPAAYALCRPPGHHAFADMAGGFCYLNNCAIAATELRRHASRVAILDVDLHHGNGTQGIFYARADLLTVSVHADPAQFYPFFWGHAHERGEGSGEGYNLNLPLPLGSGDAVFLAALDRALAEIRIYAPGALVVALGLDAFEGDPLAGLKVTTTGFHEIARRIGALKLPTVLVQEGGYPSAALGKNLISFLGGFEAGRHGHS